MAKSTASVFTSSWPVLAGGTTLRRKTFRLLSCASISSATSNWISVDAWAFERLVADCLRHEFGPCVVHHVGASGGSGDGGVDVYMVKDDEVWLIQVKRRLNSKPEPIQTIRLLNGVLLREGNCRGMVVTSAEAFSRNAAQETGIRTPGSYSVRLIDRGGVMDMFSKLHAFDFSQFLAEAYPKVIMSPLSDDMLSLLHGKVAPNGHPLAAEDDSPSSHG